MTAFRDWCPEEVFESPEEIAPDVEVWVEMRKLEGFWRFSLMAVDGISHMELVRAQDSGQSAKRAVNAAAATAYMAGMAMGLLLAEAPRV